MRFGVQVESLGEIIRRIKEEIVAGHPKEWSEEEVLEALEEMGKRVAKEVFEDVDRTLELLRLSIGIE